MAIAGIDYSMTTPAICVFDDWNGNFHSSHCYFRSNLARFECFVDKNIVGENHNQFTCDQDRYDDIAEWAMKILTNHNVTSVFLEGYSFGSMGKVFNIAENTAILKDRIWDHEIDFDVIAPSAIKKFETGKGNANKDVMYTAFSDENPSIKLKDILTPRASKAISPVSDIVDAYYICRYGVSKN